MAINAIGPVWNGNEVWLIAAGGSMVVAFPHLYAAAFSGFYLALMLVLWLLILRGVGHRVPPPGGQRRSGRTAGTSPSRRRRPLLAVLFGAAFGNVLRGVPLDADGNFVGSFALLLNPFALLVRRARPVHAGHARRGVPRDEDRRRRPGAVARALLLPLWALTLRDARVRLCRELRAFGRTSRPTSSPPLRSCSSPRSASRARPAFLSSRAARTTPAPSSAARLHCGRPRLCRRRPVPAPAARARRQPARLARHLQHRLRPSQPGRRPGHLPVWPRHRDRLPGERVPGLAGEGGARNTHVREACRRPRALGH